MADQGTNTNWQTDGKFFRAGGERTAMRGVTYGPLPGGWPASFDDDFSRIAEAHFNLVRLYEMPDQRLLDAAQQHGLAVMAGLPWEQSADFLHTPARLSAARVQLVEQLRPIARHPALAGIYVGNEIPSDLVRWMGPDAVRRAIEELIELGREIAPHLLFAYANYPSTEYLEPGNADFTAFNIYLENEGDYRRYLKRLHHIAGDRPLVVSEFGLDSQRHGTARQAELLAAAIEIAYDEDAAGFTAYAWSDRWFNAGEEVLDWDFGLTDRQGGAKPALQAVAACSMNTRTALDDRDLSLTTSVIICTRNGRERIGPCIEATQQGFRMLQTIVVDDGSTDGTAEFVAAHYPWVDLLRLPPSGLSVARNAGAKLAKGRILAFTDDDCVPDCEWLERLECLLDEKEGRYAAAGGPNLPQKPATWREAVVCAAPGAPSHVMLDDETAEHLPGCNLAVTKEAFEAIGGFDPQFHTAGDDVDFCWRLQDAGYRLGFSAGAFVWHWRRPTLRAFLKQQIGYGKAERLLRAKHPQRFTPSGGARWQGFIYGGGAVRAGKSAIIYHGAMGLAGYQAVVAGMQPLRDLEARFRHWKSILALRLVTLLSALLRGWFRQRRWCWPVNPQRPTRPSVDESEIRVFPGIGREALLQQLLDEGWQPCGDTSEWDLQQHGTRLRLATERGSHGSVRTLARADGEWDTP